jgi:ribulose-5-phosphate 4-epimerase/fuculose-1-phosphate aldolase
MKTETLDALRRDLVVGNRILAREGVVDAYGHLSVRHPARPDRFLMSRSRSCELVEADDLLELDFGGEAVMKDPPQLYLERFIHAAVYAARPDVMAVVHNHAYEMIPFAVTGTPLRPVFHAAARIGGTIPAWDIRDKFGATNLLVTNIEQARDLARGLGEHKVVLMRGHGATVTGASIYDVVATAIYARVNARMQMQAMQMGTIEFVNPEEQKLAYGIVATGPVARDRLWEYFCHRAGCDHL